jgi:hypothetical protein
MMRYPRVPIYLYGLDCCPRMDHRRKMIRRDIGWDPDSSDLVQERGQSTFFFVFYSVSTQGLFFWGDIISI